MKKKLTAACLALTAALVIAPQVAHAGPPEVVQTALELTNTNRHEHGLAALTNDPVLASFAQEQAQAYAAAEGGGERFLVNKGQAPQGYSDVESYSTSTDSLGMARIMWSTDSGLRDLAASASVNATGVGVHQGADGKYWVVQVFGWQGERPPAPTLSVTKAQGEDRYQTAVALARQEFPEASTAVLVSGTKMVDAASAAPLAAQVGAPVLLAPALAPGDYPDLARYPEFTPVLTHLVREGVRKVILVGGEASLGKGYEDALRGKGITVERVAGEDRYETSLAVALRPELSSGSHLLLSTGDMAYMADAVSAGGVAAALRSPVLLVEPGAPVHPALAGREVLALGGKLEESVVRAYGATRAAGADRYETSREVANWARGEGVRATSVNLAAGDALVDALVAGSTRRITVLVPTSGWDAATQAWLSANGVSTALAVGGRTPMA